MYKIYKIKSYNTKKINYEETTGDIDKICKKLEKDKAYHLVYSNEIQNIIFIDIDNIKDELIFFNIIDYLCLYFDLEDDERNDYIFYTKSIKDNGKLSYHLSITKYFMQCKLLKDVIIDFKEKYENISQYIDVSIYKSNNLFRLPNQTNINKCIKHTIIKGTMKNFIINYIDESRPYFESNL